ncbi:hypothetical protein TL18_04985 [Methanobrevibacter sp. YE315]|uniref:carboxypeptidase-like regulatory domain-containing protein n=1 Tax=Methanobrevibacter sp. YE315 TaxID=1609968 RepID=UPI000764E692|nr:carboxypeptidase-like regulatory domain-containing protein [Methanobrevibacter sp. YE315]AMD17430.1 hypothetical protein TL18_04985 [Methanobrevibacter sp. YE315]
MLKKIYVAFLILAVMLFSINMVCAGNFTDLSQQISDNGHVILNEDIVLNQNASNEENVYKEGISINNMEIDIDGNNHAIYGKDSNSNQVRIFNIIKSNVTLSNMIISSAAFKGSGGAIFLDADSNLILKNVTFKDNSAYGIYGEGGAIYSKGYIFIYDCKFENNSATGAAGAVYSSSVSYINNSKFVSNNANWYGGGVFSSYLMELCSCSFENNSAYSGAVLHYTLQYDNIIDHIEFNDCNFINNAANEGGVASTSSFRNIIFNRCNFTGNHANRGGVFYKCSLSRTFARECIFEDNSAKVGALFYEDSFDGDDYEILGFFALEDSVLKNNHVSDKASVFYGKSSNFWVNNTIFDNNANKAIYNGKGNISVMNSIISNYGSDFITQFLGGNITLVNNTWDVSNPNYDEIMRITGNSNVFNEKNYTESILDLNVDSVKRAYYTNMDLDCCSIYVRINETDFAIAHRRDGGINNFTQFIEHDEDYIKYFKPTAEYFFLTKIYTNGWVIGTGGWDDAVYNEKIEAIASDMVKNEYIDPDALQLIYEIKESVDCGHLLIVAPNGTYGNVMYHINNDNKSFYEIGVLGDNSFIVSPNGPDYRRQGSLDNLTNPVETCVYLASNDEYGYLRHCIQVHHIKLSDNGFSDSVYLSNEDGHLINQSNALFADYFWFKENFTAPEDIPICLDYMYIGTFYDLNRTVVSQNATRGYNSDYVFTAQLLNRDGDALVNTAVNVSVNGKSSEYVTDDNGIIEIPFTKLTTSQNIVFTNPATGEVVENLIEVVPRLVGYDVVMDYNDGFKYQVKAFDDSGNPAGENQVVTIRLDKKTYEITTDSEGLATFTIPNTLMPGTYTLEATYAGQTINNTIEVKKSGQTYDNEPEKPSYESGKNWAFGDKTDSFNHNVKLVKNSIGNDLKGIYENLDFGIIFFLELLCICSTGPVLYLCGFGVFSLLFMLMAFFI